VLEIIFLTYYLKSYFCNDIANYLKAFRPYKFLLGAFLLALYTFVATPVQYWHHHKVVHGAKQTHSKSSQQHLLFQNDGSQQDANCPVCSHKYASYSEISIIAFELCNDVTAAQHGYYQLSSVTAPSFPLPNKGPPVLMVNGQRSIVN
jgi:hypothetical protein